MAGRKKNDGRGRLGGRIAGTPNKVTTDLKTWIAEILDGGRDKFVQSMGRLTPQEYIKVYTGLLNYALPKQQAINVESQTEAEYKQLDKLIDTAPDEFVDRIAEKILKLQEGNRDE